MTRFANFVTLIISAFTVVPGILAANNVRLPVAYRGTKGWIGVEQGSSESSFTFDFSSLATNATDISWIILQTPFIYGDQNCDDLVRRIANNGTLASGTLKVQKDAVRGSWSGSMIVKMSVSSLQARSIVLTQGTDKNRQALVCANILSDDILVFESRFYGPQVVGDVYFFLDTTTKMLKLYSRLSNGNNLEPAVNWTLKNKWWIPDVDYREPGWQSCRESGDKADTRYDPPADLSSLQPETTQLLEIKDWRSDSGGGQSSAKDDLEASVLILKSQQAKSWDRYNVYGCSRIRLSDGWSAQAKGKVKNGSGMEQLVSFKQDTLFHPLFVRFKLPQQQTSGWKPAATQVHKDANNASMSSSLFVSSNSTRKSVNTPTAPAFSLHQRALSSSNDADCRRVGERLNLLLPDNSLRVESDQADDDNAAYTAYFTDAALESVANNVLMKTILVRWPNKDNADACAIVRPVQERTTFVQSSFYYPFAGAVAFVQPKTRPESTTVVAGDLHHLFDEKPSPNANWTIVVRNVDPTLDDLSCSKERGSFDPSTMGTELCRKSRSTCAIGDLSDHVGHVTIAGFDASDAASAPAYFSYASRAIPLGGPYSIVGQALKVDAGWAKACSNISSVSALALDGESACQNHGGFSDHLHRGAAATFSGSGGFNGSLFMYQSVRQEDDALPAAATSLCNYLQLSSDLKLSNLLFEILESKNGSNASAICRNASALVFNPFFVNTTSKNYATVCSKSPAQCAVGDLTARVQSVPSQRCSCVTFLPVPGPFGVMGQILRIRRADTKQILACSTFSSWEPGSVNVYVPDGVSGSQIADEVSNEFHLDDRVEVAASKDESAASKYKGCTLYDISIFDPASSSIVDTLSKYVEDKQSTWSKKWGSDKCGSGAAGLRLSFASGILAIAFLSILQWVFRI